MKHTMDELRQWQALPLSIKIRMTETRIRMWVDEYGEDGVYVSFSGGKDSTVLLDIVRNRMGYENIPAVFVDTGLEYPEIREFVKTFENVVWLKPQMNFKQVIEKYGYPFIGKEVSRHVSDVKKLGSNCFAWKLFDGTNRESMFNKERWKFLLDAPFEISNKCCNVMKKTPVHKYAKESGRHPITAQMASESLQRTAKWLQNGCNGFNLKEPISNPMSFWTEQDVLLYINLYMVPPIKKAWNEATNLHGSARRKARKYLKSISYRKTAICSVYGDIVEDISGTDEVEGQLSLEGFESTLPLKTTGCNRTGCMFCGFGCHLEKPGEGRFERMKETHPAQYAWIMKAWNEGGLGYKDVIDWINEHGNLDIRY